MAINHSYKNGNIGLMTSVVDSNTTKPSPVASVPQANGYRDPLELTGANIRANGGAWVHWLISLIKLVVFIFDFVTFPVYYLVQQPWKTLSRAKKIRAVSTTGNAAGPYRSVNPMSEREVQMHEDYKTLVDVFDMGPTLYGDRDCVGYRQVIAEESEQQPNGKTLTKLVLGDYKWLNMEELRERVFDFGNGLRSIGYEPGDRLVIFADTRVEWLIGAIACFYHKITVVTLYATLGDEGIIHGINESEAKIILTTDDQLDKLRRLMPQLPLVKDVVYIRPDYRPQPNIQQLSEMTRVRKMEEVTELGADYEVDLPEPPKKDDLCVIMYTSGSTGIPKGVLLTHGNMVSALIGYCDMAEVHSDDFYLAYLPLAHVFELCVEFLCLISGVPICYSSPLTISDRSPKVKKGCKGDASIVKPTFMIMVPLILDRIYKSVTEIMAEGKPLKREFFRFAYEYKMRNVQKGYKTPIIDWLVFRHIATLLGGRLRVIACGGAPLSPDTHDFARICLSCPLLQGYGLTETCAAATVMDVDDMSVGGCGGPICSTQVLLDDWEAGGFRTTDRPYPRGEILLSGDNVCNGYFKLDDKNKEEFVMKHGRKWFRTGDIGQVDNLGVFKIIDRKKDLVKLMQGEYVSLSKVEAELKMMGLIDNVCVYGDSYSDHLVALVVPNLKQLDQIATTLGRKDGGSVEQLCSDKDIVRTVEQMVVDHCKKSKLNKFEIPLRVTVIPDLWVPDTGLVTAAFKLKRKNLELKYRQQIDEMYSKKHIQNGGRG